MGRWEPNAMDRLREAAMELFLERGYDRTTVGEIAAHAKLTERTFFRYFTDKREVLFSGSEELERTIIESIAQSPAEVPPLEVVARALEATAPLFEPRRGLARTRQALILGHTELHERELVKLAKLTSLVAGALHSRGVPEVTARLVAETGMTVFRNAFERWIATTKHDLSHYVRATLTDLCALTADAAEPDSPAKRRKR